MSMGVGRESRGETLESILLSFSFLNLDSCRKILERFLISEIENLIHEYMDLKSIIEKNDNFFIRNMCKENKSK